jgi:hypothetical protein
MNYSSSRLTLYALISALENDLRDLISSIIPISSDVSASLGTELFEKVLGRFQDDHGEGAYISSLDDVLVYLDFPDAYQLLRIHREKMGESSSLAIKNLIPTFEKVTRIRNRVAHSRPLNYEDLPTTLDLIEKLQRDVDYKWLNL